MNFWMNRQKFDIDTMVLFYEVNSHVKANHYCMWYEK